MYFKENNDLYSLRAQTAEKISLEIIKWNTEEYTWIQTSENERGKISYSINVSGINSYYNIYYGDTVIKSKSDKNGVLKFGVKSDAKTIRVTKNLNVSQLNNSNNN